MKTLLWFRNDLRLSDNPALLAACERGEVLAVYIYDTVNPSAEARLGEASRCWLYQALASLDQQLGGRLNRYRGDPLVLIAELVERQGIDTVVWNRAYEPWQIQRDSQLKQQLKQQGIAVESYQASLLWEPWSVAKKDGSPYKVFTPYYRKGCLAQPSPRLPLPQAKPQSLLLDERSTGLDDLRLLPEKTWYQALWGHWTISEAGAKQRLAEFLKQGLANYPKGRDFPALDAVSKLSPYLHFGQLSPQQFWYAAQFACQGAAVLSEQLDCLHRELAWREFSYYLLYHWPDLGEKNFQAKFDRFPWQGGEEGLAAVQLQAWQRGQTGFPLVDAAMRELWQTGYMHNRMRMVVGSFLVKNLRLHWHCGRDWFWQCLFDADLAANSASWQWVAGCGADAAPYFRIFNPLIQSQKFDPEGHYIRRYVPELAALPDKHIHAPWRAPMAVLAQAGVVLGESYPVPLVDLKSSREQALVAYQQI